jgi:hypothetical protein
MAWLRQKARTERPARPPRSRGEDAQTSTPTAIVPKAPVSPFRVVWAEARAGEPENSLETGTGKPRGVGGFRRDLPLAPTLPPPSPSRRSAFHPETAARFDRQRPAPKRAASYAVRREGR